MKSSPYNHAFYTSYSDESQGSARIIVPFLVSTFQPRSVADVGCGIGTWLAEFQNLHIPLLAGYDGSYVQPEDFLVSWEHFTSIDLQSPPPYHGNRFDLALCLEVAEHLSEEAADRFIDFLCSLSDIVVFSAAVPFQGGTHHINEQWQGYWANKFLKRGYSVSDMLRRKFWNEPRCAYYYVQNGMVFQKNASTALQDSMGSLDCIHPQKWLQANDIRTLGLRRICDALPNAMRMAVRNLFPRR